MKHKRKRKSYRKKALQTIAVATELATIFSYFFHVLSL